MDRLNEILGINNSNSAWDNLSQRAKLRLLRNALHNGIVDVSAIKSMYNNNVLEDARDAIALQLLQLTPELSPQQLLEVYNLVEGNNQQYGCGGRINRYDKGTSDLSIVDSNQFINTPPPVVKYKEYQPYTDMTDYQKDNIQLMTPIYIMPYPSQLQLPQPLEIDYDRLLDWIMENFGSVYNGDNSSDYLVLPERHKRVNPNYVNPDLQESNVFKDLLVQEDRDELRGNGNQYKKGGKVNNKQSKLPPPMLLFGGINNDPIYGPLGNTKLKYRETLKKKEKKPVFTKIKNLKSATFDVDPFPNSTPFSLESFERVKRTKPKTWQEERAENLAKILPLLDELYPDKNMLKIIIARYDLYERELKLSLGIDYFPPLASLYRYLNVWNESNRPMLYDPRKNPTIMGERAALDYTLAPHRAFIPEGLFYYGDKDKNLDSNMIRPMTIPYGKSDVMIPSMLGYYRIPDVYSYAKLRGISPIGPNGRPKDVILMDSKWMRDRYDEGSKKYPTLMSELKALVSGDPDYYTPKPYLRGTVAEFAHAFINSHDELKKLGMEGRSYLKSLFNNKTAYKTPGEFEYNAHDVIEPLLKDYLYFTDLSYGEMTPGLLRSAAFLPIDVNSIYNDKSVLRAMGKVPYNTSDNLEWDIIKSYLKDFGDAYRDYKIKEYLDYKGPYYIGPGKHFSFGGNLFATGGKKGSSRKKTKWQYTGDPDLVIPVDVSPYEALRMAGVPFNPNTQSGYIRPLNASYGVKNSWHKKPWKGSKKYGSAVDLTPAPGYTYDDIFLALQHPVLLNWIKTNGYGILDERPASVRAKTNATGPHLHFGPDKGASKLRLSSLSADSYNPNRKYKSDADWEKMYELSRPIYDLFRKAGINPIAAMGILGNIALESSFKPDATNGTHWGYVLNDKNLRDYIIKNYGGYDKEQQIQFLIDGLTGGIRGYSGGTGRAIQQRFNKYLDAVKDITDPVTAADLWEKYYEISGGQAMYDRRNYAKKFWDRYNVPTSSLVNSLNSYNRQFYPIYVLPQLVQLV